MTIPYRLERTRAANADMRSTLRFLIQSRKRFGASFTEAKQRATLTMLDIRAAMNALAALPHQGTLRPHLGAGVRNVTKDRAVFYFTVDDDARVVRVLAVFYGGQDHQRAMLMRALGGEPG